jgi:hypothetical protein
MNARDLVNAYIKRFGESVSVHFDPLDQDGYTSISCGSATVGINVLEDQGVLLFLTQIMPVPGDTETQARLFRRLLELNFLATADGAFSIDKDRDIIYLRALRGLNGLDYDEFEDMLNTIANVADRWDDRLRDEFGEE